jgi:hypothetical protein
MDLMIAFVPHLDATQLDGLLSLVTELLEVSLPLQLILACKLSLYQLNQQVNFVIVTMHWMCLFLLLL